MTGSTLAFANPRLRRFHDYWLSKTRGELLPSRQDIDPVEIPELLPWMMLIDPVPVPDGHRFRVRLVGTGIVTRVGRDATGKWYDELFTPADVARFSAIYTEVIGSGRPHHFHSDYDVGLIRGREHIRYERLLCPLATDGTNVDMLAGVVVFLEGLKRTRA
jgi:hypothetical protein